MVDYSRFDHIGDSSDEEDSRKVHHSQIPESRLQEVSSSSTIPQRSKDMPMPALKMASKGKDGRYKFEYDGRLIYEWEQNLNEVIVYIPAPPNASKKTIDIDISPTHVRVGIKGSPPYLDEDTGGTVIAKESMWMIDDGEIIINLQKSKKAETWDSALQGREGSSIDPHSKEEVKKKLLLERFQEEVCFLYTLPYLYLNLVFLCCYECY